MMNLRTVKTVKRCKTVRNITFCSFRCFEDLTTLVPFYPGFLAGFNRFNLIPGLTPEINQCRTVIKPTLMQYPEDQQTLHTE